MAPDQIEVLNSENQAETGNAASARTDALTLKVAMGDYDRIRPLIDGRVRADAIDRDITTDNIRNFCIGLVYETFDVAEISMSWYVAARPRRALHRAAHQKERRWNGSTLQRPELPNRQCAISAVRRGDNRRRF